MVDEEYPLGLFYVLGIEFKLISLHEDVYITGCGWFSRRETTSPDYRRICRISGLRAAFFSRSYFQNSSLWTMSYSHPSLSMFSLPMTLQETQKSLMNGSPGRGPGPVVVNCNILLAGLLDWGVHAESWESSGKRVRLSSWDLEW